MIAKVITDLALDREFDYLVPPELEKVISVGNAVEVPFGRGRRPGYVLSLAENSSYTGTVKPLFGFSERRAHVPANLVKLGKWIAEYYCATQEQAIRTLLPAAVRNGKIKPRIRHRYAVADAAAAEQFVANEARRAPKRAAIVRFLLSQGSATLTDLQTELPDFSASALTGLVKDKMLSVQEEQLRRDIFGSSEVIATSPLPPTPDQQKALAVFHEMLDGKAASNVMLLHGVTNSGKTEVYLQAIAEVMARGRSAIVLVPEISLTPQTVRRFRARFGDALCVLHSRLSDGERFDEWNRINSGEVKLAVGARSALFAPFRDLGLIIVDEEHESSYKQSEAPRYMARDVAVMRGQLEHACVILGSATPSAESSYNADTGKFIRVRMEAQVENKPAPLITIADQRLNIPEKGKSNLFSPILDEAVRARLERGEQTILFLNRRGYALSLCCEQCGYEAMCPDCSVNYVYSRRRGTLSCHLCGNVIPAPERCPDCGSPEIRYTGTGTEKLESFARGAFPSARIGRMDSDTMRSAEDYEEVLEKFRRSELDILVGTQMIAKGLHFPGVTLVGVINADHGLSMPDFRAQERTFQLLTQVAGRAGRGERRGEVIFQSLHPENDTVQFAAAQDFAGFSKFDLQFREMLGYPPFTRLIAVHFRGENEMELAAYANHFAEELKPYLHDRIRLTPPAPAPIERIKGKFRYMMLIRGTGLQLLRKALRVLALHRTPPRGIEVYVDVDAQALL